MYNATFLWETVSDNFIWKTTHQALTNHLFFALKTKSYLPSAFQVQATVLSMIPRSSNDDKIFYR